MTARWVPPSFAARPVADDLWNALVALGGEPVPVGDAGARVEFSLADAPPAATWVAEASVAGLAEPFLLHVKAFPFPALFDVDLDVADLADLPEGIRQSLLEGMAAYLGEGLGEERLKGLSLGRQGLASSFPDYGSSRCQWFDVAIRLPDDNEVAVSVCAGRAAVLRLLGDALKTDAPLHDALAKNIAVAAHVSLGSISLRLADRHVLAPGAVVVMAERPPDTIMVRFRKRVFDFAKVEEGWLCQRVRAAEADRAGIVDGDGEEEMDEEGPAVKDTPITENGYDPVAEPNPDGPETPDEARPAPRTVSIEEPVSLGDLPIAVDFDLGRMKLPLNEISKWSEGAVVALEHTDARNGVAVTIRANGRIIGSGDVVLIDDRIGVRITEIYLKD